MRIFAKILLFFLVLGPVFQSPLGQFSDTIQLTSLLLLLYFLLAGKKFSKTLVIKKDLQLLLFFLGYVLIVSFPLSLVQLKTPFSGEYINSLVRPIRILLNFFGAWAIVTFYKQIYPNDFFDKVCLDITQAIFFNGVLMILEISFPTLQTFLGGFLLNNIREVHFQDVNRVGGLYLSGGAIPSMFQAIPLLIIPYLFKRKKIKFFKACIFYITLVISIVITGRSGLVLIPFSLLIMIENASIGRKLLIATLTFVVIISLPVILEYVYTLVKSSGNKLLIFNYERFLQITPLAASSRSDNTIQVLLNKFSIPSNPLTFLLGNLNFSNYIQTNVSDMGFDIILYKYGVFGFIFYYLPIVYLTVSTFKFKYLTSTPLYFLKITFLVYMILEFKEQVIYARNGYSIILLLFFAASLLEKKSYQLKFKASQYVRISRIL